MSKTTTTQIALSNIIHKQAVDVFGLVGHVSHGKTTLTYQLTGVKTQKHQKEVESNASINLGHANMKIWYDPVSGDLCSTKSTIDKYNHPDTGNPMRLLTHLSVADCPGHQKYMAAMVSGSSVMRSAVAIFAANESIPQPQAHQHLLALNYGGINDYVIVLNKMDIITRKEAQEKHVSLKNFLKDTPYLAESLKTTSIIPASCVLNQNTNQILRAIYSMAQPIPYVDKPARLNIVRSFNVNKPGIPLTELTGAVAGGTLSQGVLSIGDYVEVRPGIKIGSILQPIVARVTSLFSESYSLEHAVPGGFVGVGLSVDSGLANNNALAGFYLGHIGTLPPVFNIIKGKLKYIKALAGDTEPPVPNSKLSIVSNGSVLSGTVIHKGKKSIEIHLDKYICADEGSVLAVMIGSKLVGNLVLEKGALDGVTIKYPKGSPMDFKPGQFEIINDLESLPDQNASDFDSLLDNIQFRTTQITSVRIPPPDVSIKNRITYIKNAVDMTDKMDWAKGNQSIDILQTLMDYINKQVPTAKARITKNGETEFMMLSGIFKQGQVSEIIGRFLGFFKCPSCNSYRTYLTKVSKGYKRTCIDCTSHTSLKAIQ